MLISNWILFYLFIVIWWRGAVESFIFNAYDRCCFLDMEVIKS
jgi:hypothetical protein